MCGTKFVPGHAEVRHLHHQRVIDQTVSGSLQKRLKEGRERNRNYKLVNK